MGHETIFFISLYKTWYSLSYSQEKNEKRITQNHEYNLNS